MSQMRILPLPTDTITPFQLSSSLESTSIAEKTQSMKTLVMENKECRQALMNVIRYVLPSRDHTLKLLGYCYIENCELTEPNGTLLPEAVLMCNTILHDIEHCNEYILGNVLRLVKTFTHRELLEPMLGGVRKALCHTHPFVRRNACPTAGYLISQLENLNDLISKLIETFLYDTDCTIQTAAIYALFESGSHDCCYEAINQIITSYSRLADTVQVAIAFIAGKLNCIDATQRVQLICTLHSTLRSSIHRNTNTSSPALYELANSLLTSGSNTLCATGIVKDLLQEVVIESNISIKHSILLKIEQLLEIDPCAQNVTDAAIYALQTNTTNSSIFSRSLHSLVVQHLVVPQKIMQFISVWINMLTPKKTLSPSRNREILLSLRYLTQRGSLGSFLEFFKPETRLQEPTRRVSINSGSSHVSSGLLCAPSTSQAKELVRLTLLVISEREVGSDFQAAQLLRDLAITANSFDISWITQEFPKKCRNSPWRILLWIIGQYHTINNLDIALDCLNKSSTNLATLIHDKENVDGNYKSTSSDTPQHFNTGCDSSSIQYSLTTLLLKSHKNTYENLMQSSLVDCCKTQDMDLLKKRATQMTSDVAILLKASRDAKLSDSVRAQLMGFINGSLAILARAKKSSLEGDPAFLTPFKSDLIQNTNENTINTSSEDILKSIFMNDLEDENTEIEILERRLPKPKESTSQSIRIPTIMDLSLFSSAPPRNYAPDTTKWFNEASYMDRILHTTTIASDKDPIQVEVYTRCVLLDVIVETRLYNRLSHTITNVQHYFYSKNSISMLDLPAPISLAPCGSSTGATATLSCRLGIKEIEDAAIFGYITYTAPGIGPQILRLAPFTIHQNKELYGGTVSTTYFRNTWGSLEWENKLAIEAYKADPSDLLLKFCLETRLTPVIKEAISTGDIKSTTSPWFATEPLQPEELLNALKRSTHGSLDNKYISVLLYTRTRHGEDALCNISLYSEDSWIRGQARLRTHSQGLAVVIGDKMSKLFQNTSFNSND